MNSLGNTIISLEHGKAKYDNAMKEMLSNKQFLARILKRFVNEFHDVSVEDIENRYIEADTVTTSKVGVARNISNIEGMSSEDKTINEGNIYYDILFQVTYPGEDGRSIGMYINLEMQKNYYPGYPLEMRGAYYAARRFSSQLKSINHNTNYGCLKKVYSIWLCVGNVPDNEANTVTLYQTGKYDIIGSVNRDQNIYAMMDVIIIRLNDKKEPEDHVLKLLQTLCSDRLDKTQKIESLKQQGIKLEDTILKGVEYMCNLSDLIEERGMEKAERRFAIKLFKNGYSVEEAAEMTDAPIPKVKEWLQEEGLI